MGLKNRLINRFLDTVGDGSGTKNAIGNYSGAADDFYIAPAVGEAFIITRLLVSVEDTKDMKAEEYGNMAGLTNGITILETDDSGTITDFTDGIPVKTNAQWGRLCFDVDIKSWATAPTNELLLARYTFAKSGQPIRLDGSASGKLIVRLNDDFRNLISHYFLAQGYDQVIKE